MLENSDKVSLSTREIIKESEVSNLKIENLVEADLAHLSWAGSPLHLKTIETTLKNSSDNQMEYLVVRNPDGHPISIGKIDYSSGAEYGLISQLTTDESLRGLGIGTRLMQEMEKRIQSRNREWVKLGVEENNAQAKALYLRLGYKPYGEGKDSWEQEDRDGKISTYHADLKKKKKRLGDSYTSI